MEYRRVDGRFSDQVREIKAQVDTFGYADASVFFEQGETKVLVCVSLQQGVPPFLKGQRRGWLTAEYAMLPCSTQQRLVRDSNQVNRNSRGVEISRLIGRVLRSVVNLDTLGERTIIIDCDVLQADGSTRVACITASSIALRYAVMRWLEQKILTQDIIKDDIAAISVGLVENYILVDLSYIEDSQADADFNFIMTRAGNLIEVQGTAEKTPIPAQLFHQFYDSAQRAVEKIFDACSIYYKNNSQESMCYENKKKPSFFSLSQRVQKVSQ
jgi:ribonuclease PH